MTESSISSRAISGARWTTAGRLGAQVAQFSAGLVLARLLTPEEFGQAASVYLVSGLVLLVFDFGMGAAIVAWVDPTVRELSTIFWFSVGGGVLFGALMWAIAPAIGLFYGDPRLVPLVPLIALNFTFSFGVVHEAVLQRELRFKGLTVVSVGSAICGLALSMLLAALHLGAASLAIGVSASCLIASIGFIAVSNWRPQLVFDWSAIRKLFAFSWGLLGSRLLQYGSQNVDNLAAGRFLSVAALGFYSRAFNLMSLPLSQLTAAVGTVIYPALAQVREDRSRLRLSYCRSLRMVALLTVPVLLLLGLTAPDAVAVLWGNQWLPTAAPLSLLCVAGIARSLSMTTPWILQVVTPTSTLLVLSLVELALTGSALLVGIKFGLVGVAAAVAVSAWLYVPVNFAVTARKTGLTLRAILTNLAPALLAGAALMLVGETTWILLASSTGLARVLLTGAAAAATYTLIVWTCFPAARQDLVEIVISRRRSASA